ncbi:MAG: RNA 2',3'-cyclic phosphodiesterase [Clostridia bacterium]|nr:RNA 2',3'-cyclic phosphodiesterase [Clostridia bacterium]
MRLFIAAQTGAELKEELLLIQKKMRQSGVGGNYTVEKNLHLTLAFIGEYPDPSAVLSAMRSAPFPVSSVALCGIGSFDDLYFARLEADEALYNAVSRLRGTLQKNGIPFDRKRFTPHITLIRRARGVTELPAVKSVGCRIDRITLFRSDRTDHGMLYTALGSCECR